MSEYQKLAVNTECDYTKPLGRLVGAVENSGCDMVRLLHGAMGICTEAGEIQDAIKKTVFYGKELDRVNLAEEVGDVMWYLAIICEELGISFEQVQKANIEKLMARYPNKFTAQDAINRDLIAERKILEGNHES